MLGDAFKLQSARGVINRTRPPAGGSARDQQRPPASGSLHYVAKEVSTTAALTSAGTKVLGETNLVGEKRVGGFVLSCCGCKAWAIGASID